MKNSNRFFRNAGILFKRYQAFTGINLQVLHGCGVKNCNIIAKDTFMTSIA